MSVPHQPAPVVPRPEQSTRSAHLKDSTRDVHDEAESSSFMADLLEGRLGVAGVHALTHELHHIYEALEASVEALRETVNDPQDPLAILLDARLDRRSRLRHDLAAQGVEIREPLPETKRYTTVLAGLRDFPSTTPTLLAHHYTRYLGDLSGGQILRARFHRTLGMPKDALTFYDFSDIGPVKPYRDRYRAAVDALDFTTEEDETLVSTAIEAFRYNSAIFGALRSDARFDSLDEQ